jgi:hypothetical protein
MKSLYFAWTGFQRRQVSMAPHCGLEVVFIPITRKTSILSRAAAYIANGWMTFKQLRKDCVDVVWIQLPQVPLMWVALIYRALFNRSAIVIADCHNAMFRPPWSRVPFGISLLSKCDLVLVHNDEILITATKLGVSPNKMAVMEDPPATIAPTTIVSAEEASPPTFLVPASFSPDEPIQELVAAASGCPNASFLITGHLHRLNDSSLVASAPPNVRFVGFLPLGEFDSLLAGCDAVVAFTRNEDVQLSACGEAVGAGKPMLISDTHTLRSLFPLGSVFVDSSDPDSIRAGIHRMVENLPEHTLVARNRGSAFLERWKEQRWAPLHETIHDLYRKRNGE